jgi:hypothetical protein
MDRDEPPVQAMPRGIDAESHHARAVRKTPGDHEARCMSCHMHVGQQTDRWGHAGIFKLDTGQGMVGPVDPAQGVEA